MNREQMIQSFIMMNAKRFPDNSVPIIQQKLNSMSDSGILNAVSLDYKDPFMMLVVSFFGGTLGVDRFILGDIGMGLLKFFTIGLCGLLYFVDILLIMGRTKEVNLSKFLSTY